MINIFKICENCGKEFQAKTKRAKYCCNACKSAYRRKELAIEKNCVVCGKSFLSKYHENGYSSCCSKPCATKLLHSKEKLKIVKCVICGKEWEFKGTTTPKYCNECRKLVNNRLRIESSVRLGHTIQGFVGKGGNNKKGEENPNYKTGIGNYRRLKYDYIVENNLPIECEICGSKDFLVVHHIDHNRKNNKIENLQLICRSCHIKLHCERDELGKFTNKSTK